MTRRAAAGFARLFPALLIAVAVIVLVVAASLAACGEQSGSGPSQEPSATAAETAAATASGTAEPSASPSPSATGATTVVRLYFLRDDKLGVAERRVPRTKAVGAAALAALFGGPAEEEQAAGLSTALATGIAVNSLSISGGLAKVDVNLRSGDDLEGSETLLPTAQIVYTLTQFPSVRRVAIRVDGQPHPAFGSVDSPSQTWRRRDFVDLEPAIFVESPGVGAVLSNPFRLTGTASVYEGSFIARLVDSSERRVANAVIQASRGAPGRGSFSKQIAYSTSAKKGTLIVYQQSMEDGSRLDEVLIPVTFAAP